MTTIYVSEKARNHLPTRRSFDFYPTPLEVCVDALTHIPLAGALDILDPGAGTGVWGKAARQRWPESQITGIDVRTETVQPADYTKWLHHDFLLMESMPIYDLVIGNPPYNYAERFIKHGINMLKPGGWLLFLLRLSFLEGVDRARGLFRHFPPRQIVVRSRRVSFSGDGRTNATAYAYFVWQQGWSGDTSLTWTLGQ